MDLEFKDLHVDMVDRLINMDTETYGRIVRKATDLNHTVDFLLHVKTVAVDEHRFIIEFPNGNITTLQIPINTYHKIEVM